MAQERPTLVRIKRKRCDEPLDVFWLEERNSRKRREIDLGGLSLQDPPAGKVLFRRLQTVQISQVQDVSLSESLMSGLSAKTSTDKKDARKCAFKQIRRSSSAREQQENFSRTARYEQVWRNRRGNDAMHNYFHLYDVDRREEQRRDDELLMKYMPLLKEYCPAEFGGIDDKDETSLNTTADEFVYDVYVPESDVHLEGGEDDLLTVEVSDVLDFGLHEEPESDRDSEDSNCEDHPDCDYPDEEEDEEGNSYCDSDEEDDKEDWR